MESLQDLISKYVDNEDVPALDILFERISVNGTPEEKEILADGYISNFGQCHYDYMCHKFNEPEWIWDLMDWIEKIKTLTPDFDQYNYFKGHVFEMLSSVSEVFDDKQKYRDLCIEYLRNQRKVDGEDVTLLIDLAQNLFQRCRLLSEYPKQVMDEIKALFVEALHLERKTEHQYSFFGFNGSAISASLNMSYEILALPIDQKEVFHAGFLSAFKQVIHQYAKKEPAIFYHWADTLIHITDWINYPKIESCRISDEIVKEVWEDAKEALHYITDLKSENEHFVTSIGHLFNKIAEKEASIPYYDVALKYYLRAIEINSKTWSNPHYASNVLRMKALILIEKGNQAEAEILFKQGIQIFEDVQKQFSDFQLSLHHGDFLFDYAKYFEDFSNKNTLSEAQKQFEASRSMANDFYTEPFYGLAKTALYLGNKEECLKVLTECGNIFSNEYHTHDFNEIIGDEDFERIQDDLPRIIAQLDLLKNIDPL